MTGRIRRSRGSLIIRHCDNCDNCDNFSYILGGKKTGNSRDTAVRDGAYIENRVTVVTLSHDKHHVMTIANVQRILNVQDRRRGCGNQHALGADEAQGRNGDGTGNTGSDTLHFVFDDSSGDDEIIYRNIASLGTEYSFFTSGTASGK